MNDEQTPNVRSIGIQRMSWNVWYAGVLNISGPESWVWFVGKDDSPTRYTVKAVLSNK